MHRTNGYPVTIPTSLLSIFFSEINSKQNSNGFYYCSETQHIKLKYTFPLKIQEYSKEDIISHISFHLNQILPKIRLSL